MDDEQIKANRIKWLEELESGKWNQARKAWRGLNIEGKECHCCLDVANLTIAPECDYNGSDQAVYKHIFLDTTSKRLGIGKDDSYGHPGSLAWFIKMNDTYEYSFIRIAEEARKLWNLPKAE